jgi:hypothetical protein
VSITPNLIATGSLRASRLAHSRQIHRAVADWIRHDAGMAIKMTATPQLVDQLVERITAALLEPKAPHEAERTSHD